MFCVQLGACTNIMYMLLDGNLSVHAFHTMGSMLDDAMLVHKNLLCVIYCWPLTFQLKLIL